MYILSNGVKITEKVHKKLCQAIKDPNRKYIYFLNMATGKLVRISCAYRQKLAVIKKQNQRFIPLPKVTEEERRERFRYFVEELGIIDVPELKERLREELKKGASIDKLEQILEKDPSGWIHGWVQNEYDFLAEKIDKWIKSPPLNAKDDPDYWYDDDCPVCQLMRKTEEENRPLTLSEIWEAFRKAKKSSDRKRII